MRKKVIIGLTIIAVSFGIWYFINRSFREDNQIEEQITISSIDDNSDSSDSLLNYVTGNITMKQISTFPSKVILTGLIDHRLVSIYKSKPINDNNTISKLRYDNGEYEDESNTHFMPGIDILFGFNLLNIAHYDLKLEKVNYLFNHPVLVKTLYYPSFIPDSLEKKAINRNFYLVSVYDEDTNKDGLINNKDLRRFYHFNATSILRTQLIPNNYSTIRSQYDSKNDIMYIFAGLDENKNGTQDKTEPIHVFWFSLKTPDKAKLLY